VSLIDHLVYRRRLWPSMASSTALGKRVNVPSSDPGSVAAPRPKRSHEPRAGADRHHLTAGALARVGKPWIAARPSCGSIKTAILSSRPASGDAAARSGGPGCPTGTALGGAQCPGRPRARRHSQCRDGRRFRIGHGPDDSVDASAASLQIVHQRPNSNVPEKRRAGYARFFTGADIGKLPEGCIVLMTDLRGHIQPG
jgi:hypothetical protein